MTVSNGVRVMAGLFILLSLLLSRIHSELWLLFTTFVGVNLIQSVFTGVCPVEKILKAIGLKDK